MRLCSFKGRRVKRHQGGYSGDLFAIPRPASTLPGTMDFRPAVSSLIATMLDEARHVGIDRHSVAANASRLSGKDVTKNMLDGYTACAREEFNCPLWLAPVLEVVCCSTVLTSWHASVHGGQVSVGADAMHAEVGRLIRERELVDCRLREMKDLLRRSI